MSVDEKPPDSGFQPEPTSVLMFGSLLTIGVARGAAFGEKAAAEPSASARTVLAMAAACLRGPEVSYACSAAYRLQLLVRASLCRHCAAKPRSSSQRTRCLHV